jgi:hypothetical protein
VIDSYWSDAEVEARIASVGAVFHQPPAPRGWRERRAVKKRIAALYETYCAGHPGGVPFARTTNPLSRYTRDYWLGKIDTETGYYTKAARDEARAGIG